MTTQKSYDQALKKWLEIAPDEYGAPDLSVGNFILNKNEQLILELSETVSNNSDLMSFSTFQKLLLTKGEKPKPPILGDSIFDLPNISYDSPLERQVASVVRYKNAQKDYEKRNAHYQETFERPRALVSSYRANTDGYLDYVRSAFADDPNSFFFKSLPFRISENARRTHTFLAGGTGAGKSEALKFLIRHYETQNTETAVIILDPHGKLAAEVAAFSEHLQNDRLAYIDLNLSDVHKATLNAFETSDKSEKGLETQSAQLKSAFEQILGGFTLNMESLLIPCLTLLLHRDGSDLSDFVRLMDKKHNHDLIRYGQEHLPFEGHRTFFKERFFSNLYDSTKEALINRFQHLLNVPTIKNFTCGPSTFDLEALIDKKKVVIFNLSIAGASRDAVTVIGQFITALVQSYAIRRDKLQNRPKVPIHFFADECQYFISNTTEEILGESRKYGLYLTLATQRTEQVGAKLLDAILGNVGLFFVGRSLGKTLPKMSKTIEVAEDEISKLTAGRFFVKQTGRSAICTRLPLVGQKYAMNEVEWCNVKNQQLSLFYKPVPTESARSTSPLKTPQRKSQPPKVGALVFPKPPNAPES